MNQSEQFMTQMQANMKYPVDHSYKNMFRFNFTTKN